MTDKEYREQKNRIRKLRKKWHKNLGLNWWAVDYEYSRENKPEVESTVYAPKDVKGVWQTVMSTRSDANYLQATITSFLPQTQQLTDDQLEETFLHECMHILLAPLHDKKYAKEEELVATQLARAFIWSQK